MTPKTRFSLRLLAALFFIVAFHPISSFAQDDATATLKGSVEGLGERITTLEGTVGSMSKLKISGYVQPQWVWQGVDSLVNPQFTRSFFQVRRGRVKFTYKSGDIGAVVYPDITEQGVIIKEVFATWDFAHDQGSTLAQLALGAMNRPFGYEIAYSSSAREVVERSTAENRLFNGERDLGAQLAVSPTFGSLKPVLEFGLFNGSDNFGAGPVSDVGNSGASSNISSGNLFFFSNGGNQIQGSVATVTPKGADSLYFLNKLNPAITASVAAGAPLVVANGWKQNQKELLGHIRLPFLLSDDFSFDVGGSWSIGGITPPSDIEATYSDGGKIVLAKSTSGAPHVFNQKTGWEPSGLFLSNRTVFGVDAQFYLSVLPIGGTILKGEMYTGKVPFYGSPALMSSGDTATFGSPTPILVEKNVLGYYVMLVQNFTDWLQLAVRYDSYDPNTNVQGSDFAAAPTINGVSYLKAANNFGGDLKLNTLTIGLNLFVQGNLRFMLDYDHAQQEEFTKVVSGTTVTIGSPNLDRFTGRMQVKF
jgi:hypothetical protein